VCVSNTATAPVTIPPVCGLDGAGRSGYGGEVLGRVLLVLAVAVCGGCGTSTCVLDEVTLSAQLADPAAFQVHLVSGGDAYDLGFHGTAANLSMERDCRVALYSFPEAPDPAELEALADGETAPQQRAGGTLIADYTLPRRGAHSFAVAIDYTTIGSGSFTPPTYERWIAAVPCIGAEVSLDLEFYVTLCRDGFRTPSYTPPFVEQIW